MNNISDLISIHNMIEEDSFEGSAKAMDGIFNSARIIDKGNMADLDYRQAIPNKILDYSKTNYTQGKTFTGWDSEYTVATARCGVMAVGLIGSALIIYTMFRGNMFVSTYRTYLTLIALLDVVMLFIYCGNKAIYTFTAFDPILSLLLQSDVCCRAFHVFNGFFHHFIVWLHVAIMIELYVMLSFPKKMNSTSSLERAHYMTLLLLTVLLVINMNYFWTIKRQKEPLGIEAENLCYYDSSFEVFETKIYPVLDCAVLGFFPAIICFTLILTSLCRYRHLNKSAVGGLLIPAKEYLRMSSSMTILFMIGHLPRFTWYMLKFLNYTWEARDNPGISTLQNFHTELINGEFKVDLFFSVCTSLRIFVLLTVSSHFRQELCKCKRQCCCQRYCSDKPFSRKPQHSSVSSGGTPLMSTSHSLASNSRGMDKLA